MSAPSRFMSRNEENSEEVDVIFFGVKLSTLLNKQNKQNRSHTKIRIK